MTVGMCRNDEKKNISFAPNRFFQFLESVFLMILPIYLEGAGA